MTTYPRTTLTPQEYLAFERQAEGKNEYIDGVVQPMVGASRWQARLNSNLLGLLYEAVHDSPGEVLGSLMRIKVPPCTYLYPDVVVVAEEARLEDEHEDTLLNPAVVFEIVPRRPRGFDPLAKIDLWRAIPSLTDLVLIAEVEPRVLHHHRDADGAWRVAEVTDDADTVDLPSLGLSLPLAHIYRRVMPLEQAEHGPD